MPISFKMMLLVPDTDSDGSVDALREYGEPVFLPRCAGWVLERKFAWYGKNPEVLCYQIAWSTGLLNSGMLPWTTSPAGLTI